MDLVTLQPNPRAVETRRFLLDRLLVARPKALVEAARMLIKDQAAIVHVLTRYGYTDPRTIGGYVDRDLATLD